MLLILGLAITSAQVAFIRGLLDTPPIAIDVRAEPTFDPHDPSRQRFGQRISRWVDLKSSYSAMAADAPCSVLVVMMPGAIHHAAAAPAVVLMNVRRIGKAGEMPLK